MKTRDSRILAGFTLVELLVVVSIVAIISGVLLVNFSASSAASRDAKRQSDLRNLQNAIELYKNKYGRYPEGCNGPNVWSGQQGTTDACGGGDTQYIVDLAPEFIRVLPVDPRPVSGQQGYAYTVSADGSVYKLIAMNVVESEIVSPTHEFGSCPMAANSAGTAHLTGLNGFNAGGWCASRSSLAGLGGYNSGGFTPQCIFSGTGTFRYDVSYGVWGGVHPQTIQRLEVQIGPSPTCPSGTARFDPRTIQPLDVNGLPLSSTNEWRCRADVVADTTRILCR